MCNMRKHFIGSTVVFNPMESDLLKRENEFYRENEKLEQKTKELLKQVNDVMKIQDNLIRDSLRTKTELNYVKLNNLQTLGNKTQEPVNSELGDDIPNIPKTVDAMGVQGANQFYRAKIKTLQVENIKLQSDVRKKTEDIKKLQKENQFIQEEKEKWFMSYNNTKSTIGKLESQISCLNLKLQGKESELTAMKKDLEQMKKELKNSTLNANNFEVRLNRIHEENEKLKNALKMTKDEEKDMKESYRKQINDLTITVKQIEKHKNELLNGFKKQLQLIDNLKKQKVYLESIKISEVAETEYLKILDWKME